MKSWIKAGFLGGFLCILVVLVIATIGYLGSFFLISGLLAILYLFFATGVWAVAWSPSLPQVRQAAILGALAGLVASVVVGLALLILTNVLFGKMADAQSVFEYLLSQIKTTFYWMLFSAIGAFVYTAIKKDNKQPLS